MFTETIYNFRVSIKEYDKEKKLYLKHESNIHETNNISPNHEHCIT